MTQKKYKIKIYIKKKKIMRLKNTKGLKCQTKNTEKV